MKNWLKKNLSLLIFAGFAIFFGYIYWLIPIGLAIVAAFFFSAKRWGDEISGSAKKAFVVFFVCGVFVGTVRFSNSAFLKNLKNEDLSADLNKLKPETLKAPVEASTVNVLLEMNDSVQAAYRRKQLEYKKLGVWYSERGVVDSAAICIDSVVSIHKQALASQSQYERLLRERSQAAEMVGGSVTATDNQKAESLRPFAVAVLPGERQVTEYIMEAGASYEIRASSEYVFEHSDKYGQPAFTRMPQRGYWQVGFRNGNLTVKNLSSSDTLRIEIRKEA